MRYAVYIIYSEGHDKCYIGHTNDPKRRIAEHNSERADWTKRYQPWKLVYTEAFPTRTQAMRQEKYLKSLKNKDRLKQYIAGWRSSTSGGS